MRVAAPLGDTCQLIIKATKPFVALSVVKAPSRGPAAWRSWHSSYAQRDLPSNSPTEEWRSKTRQHIRKMMADLSPHPPKALLESAEFRKGMES